MKPTPFEPKAWVGKGEVTWIGPKRVALSITPNEEEDFMKSFQCFLRRCQRYWSLHPSGWWIFLFTLGLSAPKTDAAVYGDFVYQRAGGTVTITGYTGSDGQVVIPDVIDGTAVTGIGGGLFTGAERLVSIAIPNGVVSIREGIFRGCARLQNITVTGENPVYASVEGVLFDKKVSTLLQCPAGRPGEYKVPDSVVAIGNAAFYGCQNLERITMPEGVISIGDEAFAQCVVLSDPLIPSQLTIVGYGAFRGCSGFVNLALPSNLSSIGKGAFEQCINLVAITVDEANLSYSDVDGVLFDKQRRSLLRCPVAKQGYFRVPDGVTRICDSAFEGCSQLTEVELPSSLAIVGCLAFSECSGLMQVGLPKSVTAIGYSAFAGCSNMVELILPGQLTVIGEDTFCDCVRLQNVEIPSSVVRIGDEAFLGCQSLQRVVIPNGVTNIGCSAFAGCTSLGEVTIPGSVVTLGKGAFGGCASMMAITVDSLNPTYQSVDGVLYDKKQSVLIQFPGGKYGRCMIPETVNQIADKAFNNCFGLITVSIPESVLNIAPEAFAGCVNLASITVAPFNPVYSSVGGVLYNKGQSRLICHPAGRNGWFTIPISVASIEAYAFANCGGVKGVSVPETVTQIGQGAFHSCLSLACIQVDSHNPAYASVDGVLLDKRKTRLLQYPSGKQGIWVIPNSVMQIDDLAFHYCVGLERIVIPKNITSLGWKMFQGCIGLTNVTIEGDVTTVASGTFAQCYSLESVVFKGNAPVNVGNGVFESDAQVIVYYCNENQGWETTFAGCPTALWMPQSAYLEWVCATGLEYSHPNACGEEDDPDEDGMDNKSEMMAGTDPLNRESVLKFESISTDLLCEEDKGPIETFQHALYFQSVPGATYVVESTESLGAAWSIDTVVTALTAQKRIVLEKPVGCRFYRVMVVP